MDDVRAQASQWCEEARRLCGARETSDLESLSAWLNAIDAGLRLRRQLDGLGPDETIESSRLEVVRGLTELQLLADAAMTGLQPGTPAVHLIAARVKEGLAEARAAVRSVLTGLRLGPLHQAMAIEGLRSDLEWLSTLVARLDGETPHPVSTWLDVELQRLRAWLGTAPGPEPDPNDESLRAGCERMQAVLLERRIQRRARTALRRLERRRALGRAIPSLAAPDPGRDARARLFGGHQGRPRRVARSRWINVVPSWPPTPLTGSARSTHPAGPKPATSSSRRLSTKSARRSHFLKICHYVAPSNGSN